MTTFYYYLCSWGHLHLLYLYVLLCISCQLHSLWPLQLEMNRWENFWYRNQQILQIGFSCVCLHRELAVNIYQHTTDQTYHRHLTNSIWMNAFNFKWILIAFECFIHGHISSYFFRIYSISPAQSLFFQVHFQAFFLECGLHTCCSWNACLLHLSDFILLRPREIFRFFDLK